MHLELESIMTRTVEMYFKNKKVDNKYNNYVMEEMNKSQDCIPLGLKITSHKKSIYGICLCCIETLYSIKAV